ncbi:MAG: cytidine deaminase [Anaerovoracaceae bacterium]|jgi:cytidine deaminase
MTRETEKSTAAGGAVSAAYRSLYEEAGRALRHAYAPYSGFAVGAALLCEDGRIYTGVNVENASYGAAICAERTAAVKAVSEGERRFRALAVRSAGGSAWPCGICRQFLYEFAPELDVISGEDVDHLEVFPLSALLVKGFRL